MHLPENTFVFIGYYEYGHTMSQMNPGSNFATPPTWWRSLVLAARCPPARTSSTQCMGGTGRACRDLLGRNLG